MKKRIISLLMALALCLSLLPTAALAAEGEPTEQPVEQEQFEPVEPTPAEPEEGAPVEDAEEEEKEELPEEPKEKQDAPALLLAAAPRAVTNGHTHYLCGGDTCNGGSHERESLKTTFATEIKQEGNTLKIGGEEWKKTDEAYWLAGGVYYLSSDIKPDAQIRLNGNVTLCLNGHSITATHNTDVINVYSGKTFTLTDCSTGGAGKITHTTPNGGGVYVTGTFNMYGGSITGNKANIRGGGVHVNGGSFKMFGGSITGNTAGTSGGGVCVNGGNSSFTMKGGSITGNKADGTGGGVFVNNGSFEMSGSASIIGNNVGTGKDGGGVYVNGKFTMSGGEIRNNTAPDTGNGGGVFVNHNGTFNMSDDSRITGNTAFRGGGVYVERILGSNNYNKPGNFAMSSGTIGGTTTTDDANQAEYGGGVYVAGTFTLTGGSITGNKTKGNGGGVYVNADSTFTVSGAPKITDNTQKPTISSNVYLTTGKPGAVIVIGGAHLASGAEIGVRTGETPTVGTPVTIATNANSGDKQYFSSDESEYSMYVEGSELKLAIVPAHEHRWTYTADGATITAKCGDNSCTSKDGGSVTIKAPAALTYDGTTKAAAVDKDTGSWQGGDVTIAYKQGDKVLTGAPVNAGTYTASITAGGETASVEYTIAKATPSVSGSGTATGTYGQKLSEVAVNGLTAKLGEKTVEGRWALTGNTSNILNTVGSTSEYTAIFTPTDTTNFTTAEAEVAVTVNPKAGGSLGTVNLTQKFTDTAEKTYTPNWAGLPTGERWSYVGNMTTSNGGITLNKNDFDADGKKLIYSISGGQVNDTVTFTLKAICADNHYDPFTITVVVKLTDKDTPTVKANNINVTYTGENIPASAITGTAIFDNVSVAGTWSWKSTAPKNVADSGNHTVVFTPADSANYSSVETIITVTIAKATPTGEPKYTKIAAGGKTLADAGLTVTGSTLSPNAGELVWVDDAGNALANTTVVEKNTTYKWRFTPNDANYEALTGSVELYHVSGGYYYYTPAAGGTTDANKSPRTGDAGLLVYGLTALSSCTGTALVLRRKRED